MRTARSSSVTAASPFSGSTDANPMKASGWSRAHCATKSFVTGGRPVFVSASHASSTPSTSAARNTSAISVDLVARQRRAEVRLARGPKSPIAASTYSGRRRVDVEVDRPRHGDDASVAGVDSAAAAARRIERVRPVAPVARLGERVGAERLELLRGDELLDRRRDASVGVQQVEVVDDLAALVAEVALVLETGRTAHEPGNLAGRCSRSGFGGPDALFAARGGRFSPVISDTTGELRSGGTERMRKHRWLRLLAVVSALAHRARRVRRRR